jgi:hypothetical protein
VNPYAPISTEEDYRVTNRELLSAAREVLTELDRQRQFLLQTDGTPMPCPACKNPVNLFDAAGIDLDAYDFGSTSYACRCPSCQAELEQILPFMAGLGPPWHWQLKDSWLQEQLSKARAFEQQNPSDVSNQSS